MFQSLSPKYQELLRQKVESGSYQSEIEVIEEALTLLDNRDNLEGLRQSLIEADAAIDRGEGAEWTPELKERIRAQSREVARQGVGPDPDVWP